MTRSTRKGIVPSDSMGVPMVHCECRRVEHCSQRSRTQEPRAQFLPPGRTPRCDRPQRGRFHCVERGGRIDYLIIPIGSGPRCVRRGLQSNTFPVPGVPLCASSVGCLLQFCALPFSIRAFIHGTGRSESWRCRHLRRRICTCTERILFFDRGCGFSPRSPRCFGPWCRALDDQCAAPRRIDK